MDSARIVRRFIAKGTFKLSEEALDEAATLLDSLKEVLRDEDHSADEKKKALGAPLADLSAKLHHVFVRMRRYDVDFEPKEGNVEGVKSLGSKLHIAEAALQRLANFILHPEKYGPDDFHEHVEAAYKLAHEAFKGVHATFAAAKAIKPL